MKRVFVCITAVFLLLCVGCKTIDGTSSVIEELTNIVEDNLLSEESSEDTSSVESLPPASALSTPDTPSKPAQTVTPTTPTSPPNVIVETEIKDDEYVVVKPKPIVIKGDKPMSYEKLSDEQKRIYGILEAALLDMVDENIDLQMNDASNVSNDLNVAFRAVSFDNPEMFWIPTGYALKQSGNRYFVAFKYSDSNSGVSYDYPVSKSERDNMKNTLDEKVNELANAVKDKDSFEAELYIHDYLCQNVAYTLPAENEPEDPLIYTSYGALVNGKAVCEGYSRAMQLICDKLKIPCGLVYGWSQGVGHMWNIINPGDGWYHLDVTWDDDEMNGIISHRYFNITKENIIYEDSQCNGHTIADDFKKSKKYSDTDVFNFLSSDCNNTALNYFIRNNYTVSALDEKDVAFIKYIADECPLSFEIQNNSGKSAKEVVEFVIRVLNKGVAYYNSYNIITIIQ